MDQALLSYLRRQRHEEKDGEPSSEEMQYQKLNCLGVSARPDPLVIAQIQDIQKKISSLIGESFYSMPASLLHISNIELAHRHTLKYLHSISSAVGTVRLHRILDLVSDIDTAPRLVSPCLSFDATGIALTFLPDRTQDFTYHHLRANMHAIALESCESFDMCYTAPSAHVTLGRFVGSSFFDSKDSRREFVHLIEQINAELQAKSKDTKKWSLGETLSLEVQAGYLKFGVERKVADLLGRESGSRRENSS